MKRKLLLILCFTTLFLSCKTVSTHSNYSNDLEKILTKNDFVKVPLKKGITGHIIVEVYINNIKSKMILDTGASNTVIEIKQKDNFKMQTKKSEIFATGVGGNELKTFISANNKLKFGDLSFENVQFILMDLDHVNNALKMLGSEEVSGIIGGDILLENNAIIDYKNLTLYIRM
ncbi:retropepsin-like aspartic protease [Aureivirga sp. CE67]|uniref:retropepsin-like aspartic protease n=1 Tax=Aureivirga sp. CE67 TaxID=1788983 RepID=UPI0018C90A72|nr:retropepsin-like aspartic protease [Aureivirga sp. CE67]